MGMKETSLNIVWIILFICVLVVATVVRAPLQGRVLGRGRAEEQVDDAQGREGLVGLVCEEPVVAAGDRDGAADEPERPQAHRPPGELDGGHVDDRPHGHQVGEP